MHFFIFFKNQKFLQHLVNIPKKFRFCGKVLLVRELKSLQIMAYLTTFCLFVCFSPNRHSGQLSDLNLSDNQSHNTWHNISVISNVLTEKQTGSYLQQLQELKTSGKIMKNNKNWCHWQIHLSRDLLPYQCLGTN